MSLASPQREVAGQDAVNEPPADSYQSLRQLLLGPEQAAIAALRQRLDNPDIRAEELSGIIAEVIVLRSRRDRALQNALNPLVEEALRISVARNPQLLADTMFPIIGRAVRNSVAHSLRAIVNSLNETVERSLSWEALKWRFESLRTGKPFGEIVLARSLRYRVEQVFVIHRETGLLVAHVSRQMDHEQENEMIAGMLTAVQDFVHDSFSDTRGAELDTVELGEFNVWIQHGPQALLCAVVTGTPPLELRNFLQRTLEELHSKFASVLAHYDGETSSASAMRPLLEACLVGQHRPQRTRLVSRGLMWVSVSVAVLLIAFAGYWLLQRYRWNRAVENLRAEPGIILISEEKVWGGYRLSGLRDPMAVDPAQVILQAGVNPAKVNAHWEPYTSMDPRFELPRQISETKALIERQEILFHVNSFELGPEQLLKLTDIAAELQKLLGYASAGHETLKVEVDGHTDPTGPEEKNAALSEQRADEVINALESHGISADLLSPVAMGSHDAITGGAGSSAPDLSRRVTFRVLVGDAKQ